LYTADSEEELLTMLLRPRDADRGQGTWVWSVVAKQSDPDAIVGELDPDPGNDWSLTVEVVIMRPSLTEVAVGGAEE